MRRLTRRRLQYLQRWPCAPGMVPMMEVTVYQRGPSHLRDAKTARRIVGLLEDHGYLVRIPGGAVMEGEQRRDVWRVWQANTPYPEQLSQL
jgi:hypothetical protein